MVSRVYHVILILSQLSKIQSSSEDGYPFFVISILFTSYRRPSKTIPIHSYSFLILRGILFLSVAFLLKLVQIQKTEINCYIMQITEVVI